MLLKCLLECPENSEAELVLLTARPSIGLRLRAVLSRGQRAQKGHV